MIMALLILILFIPIIGIADENPYSIPPREDKIHDIFKGYLLDSQDKSPRKIWIFLTDKGIFNKSQFDAEAERLENTLPADVIDRRKVRCDNGFVIDMHDIPVKREYILQLQELGFDVLYQSRWLNAVSGFADADVILNLIDLEFIAEIRPVAKYHRPIENDNGDNPDKDIPDPGSLEPLDYGLSLKQTEMINARLMHQIGLDGIGVKIAIMDGGFNYDLPVFTDTKIIDEYDFVNDEISVQSDEPVDDSHGTRVLSLIGGYLDNELIGIAYNSEFLLYQTEDIFGEYIGEEDNWVAAAERADLNDADIITTSVGYLDWYNYSDLNGLTAPITVAADIAFSRGIVVVTSAGNERDNDFYYITPPADAFNIISVGAIDSFGVITSFSSAGPSYDGRTKPEVVALGYNVHCGRFDGTFGPSNGTSFAAPLVAGGIALILDAHNTNILASDLRDNVIRSGDRYESPDNLYGYGLPDMFKASAILKIAPVPDISAAIGQYTIIPLEISHPTPISPLILENAPDSAFITDDNGRWKFIYYGFKEDIGSYDVRIIINDTLADIPQADTAEFELRVVERANIAFGPNPFSDSLSIFVHSDVGKIEDISIFTISGDKVWDNSSDNYNNLTKSVVWDGTNNQGREVAPGVYLVVVRAQWAREHFKVFKK